MRKLLFLNIISAFLLISCSQKQEEGVRMYNVEDADYAPANDGKDEEKASPETYISSSAAVVNPNDSAKMIRIADVKFKVKDVIKATYKIENIILQQGGYVANTRLGSNINEVRETLKSQDSTVVTTYYIIENTMTLRIPSVKLDTTLKEIAQLVEFMDYRVINTRNVTLDLLAKQLEQSRLARYNSRMGKAIDEKGKRLSDVSDAEENLLYRAQQADEARITNLLLNDSIKFSTIRLFIYQNQSVKNEITTSDKVYKTPFGTRFVSAVKFGWTIITEVLLFVVNLWAIILIAAVIFYSVKFIRKKYFKKNK